MTAEMFPLNVVGSELLMYGMIHKAARQFVIEDRGQATWTAIVEQCDLNDEHFISGQHYSDEVTVSLLGQISKNLNRPLQDLLFDFGKYWVKFTAKSSYANVLEMAGDDLVTFLDNLDTMHRSIKATMPEAVMPTFAVTRHDGPNIELLYRSEREGLEDFVRGLLYGLLDRFSEHGEIAVGHRDGDIFFSISRRQAA